MERSERPEDNGPETEPLQFRPIAEEPKPTFWQRVNNIRKNITVEPVAFLMLFASILAGLTTQTFVLEKTCRVNLNLSDAICDAVKNQNTDNNTEYERQVQEYVANLATWKSVITSVIPCILLVFVGGWMDLTGRRKVMMLLPVTGEIFQNLSNILNFVFFYQLRVEYLIFLDAFFSAITGGWSIMFLAIFSYIADITTNENRTYRLGLVSFCTYVGFPIGMAMSGVMLKQLGYLAIYITAMSLHVLNLLYITFCIRDPARTKEMKEHDNRGLCYILKTFFNPSHILETLRVVFKKTQDNRRVRIFILLGVVCILFGPMYGEVAVLYMSTRYRFNWDEVKFSLFQTYNFVAHTSGTLFTILVLSKYLSWHDSLLGIISTLSKIASSFVYCFAPNERIFYIAPIVDILNGSALLAIRSIFSKIVAPTELGKMNSVLGFTETLMPLLYVPLYMQVYTATMQTLPGAVFLLGACMSLPAVGVFIWLFVEHRRGLRNPVKPANGIEDMELHTS